ncbi:hypothetical protein HU200_030103 [Digitaria exilis]|uniref:Uncharacterized protein n=1 Tax=Digitaria exilis TaxID=1010633 RepID=A0A835BS95_9POAL|nr:hypothetical protein HU200_030103 [Digitaria exilis]CAB3492541.1 unnamed protein product [Digitaria exilis]
MARSEIPAAFFSPPTLPEAARPPEWVLMDKLGYIAKRENATTAWGISNFGDLVEVSFCLADPPVISYMCVHLPGNVGHVNSGFGSIPTVVAAAGAFVLLELSLCFGCHGGPYYASFGFGRAGPRLRL